SRSRSRRTVRSRCARRRGRGGGRSSPAARSSRSGPHRGRSRRARRAPGPGRRAARAAGWCGGGGGSSGLLPDVAGEGGERLGVGLELLRGVVVAERVEPVEEGGGALGDQGVEPTGEGLPGGLR